MTDITLTINGPFLKSEYQSMNINEMADRMMKDLIASTTESIVVSIKEAITAEIGKSVQLAAFVGQNTDPEIIRNIINGIEVKADQAWPPSITIECVDSVGKWFGNREIPEELAEMLTQIIDGVLSRWSDRDMQTKLDEAIRSKA